MEKIVIMGESISIQREKDEKARVEFMAKCISARADLEGLKTLIRAYINLYKVIENDCQPARGIERCNDCREAAESCEKVSDLAELFSQLEKV